MWQGRQRFTKGMRSATRCRRRTAQRCMVAGLLSVLSVGYFRVLSANAAVDGSVSNFLHCLQMALVEEQSHLACMADQPCQVSMRVSVLHTSSCAMLCRCSVRWDDERGHFWAPAHAKSVQLCSLRQALNILDASYEGYDPGYFDGQGECYLKAKKLELDSMVRCFRRCIATTTMFVAKHGALLQAMHCVVENVLLSSTVHSLNGFSERVSFVLPSWSCICPRPKKLKTNCPLELAANHITQMSPMISTNTLHGQHMHLFRLLTMNQQSAAGVCSINHL